MAGNTSYLITGANRGIGRALTATLLLRPSTTVVATVRDPSDETATSLSSLPLADGSKLIVLKLDVSQPHNLLLSDLAASGVEHLDVVVNNAGGSSGYLPVMDTDPQKLRDDFDVNAVAVLRLFQATWPLLEKGEAKKFVLISSSVGSIAGMDEENMPGATYGASKAAANWLAKKISLEFKNQGLKVSICHPGWVKTNMGQGLADAVGFSEPPMSVEDSKNLVLEQIDALSAETSGKFLYGKMELPW